MDGKVLFAFVSTISVVHSNNYFFGQTQNNTGIVRKVNEKRVEASGSGIPQIRQEQDVYFEYPTGDQKIKGIAIKDLDNGLADACINKGGLGFNFVNIRVKSELGSGYNFLIEIYA